MGIINSILKSNSFQIASATMVGIGILAGIICAIIAIYCAFNKCGGNSSNSGNQGGEIDNPGGNEGGTSLQ